MKYPTGKCRECIFAPRKNGKVDCTTPLKGCKKGCKNGKEIPEFEGTWEELENLFKGGLV